MVVPIIVERKVPIRSVAKLIGCLKDYQINVFEHGTTPEVFKKQNGHPTTPPSLEKRMLMSLSFTITKTLIYKQIRNG
jgi:hypothetical protein